MCYGLQYELEELDEVELRGKISVENGCELL